MLTFITNPPWRKGDRLGVRSGSRWPFTQAKTAPDDTIPGYLPYPFYLAYATSVLRRDGHEVILLDALAEGMDMDAFIERVRETKPGLLLMETSTPSFDSDVLIARDVRPYVGALAFAGPHATANPLEVINENPEIDYVLLGEFEPVLLQLVEHLKAGKPVDDIPGLAYRLPSGNAKNNGRAKQTKDVNWYPWPERDDLPMANYRDRFADMPEPMLQMWASRGCPYTCIFCVWPAVMYEPKTYRPRDPEDIANEMAHAVERYGMKSVYFDDDTFNVGKKRMMQLARAIKARELGVPWAMMARADLVDDEMLSVMVDSGLFAAKYGIESGCQEIVTRSSKNLDLAKAETGIRLTKEHGVKVHLTYSFGLPGETWDTVRKTIDHALRMDPTTLQFSINTPFPGTPYHTIATEQGTLQQNGGQDFDGWASAVIRTEAMSASEIERALEMAHEAWERNVMWRQVRQNPLWAAKKVFSNPRGAVDILKKRLAGSKAKLPVGA